MGRMSGVRGQQKRTTIRMQYGLECRLCGGDIVDYRDFTLDHILPKALGGKDANENLWPAHKQCNYDRGVKSLEEWVEFYLERIEMQELLEKYAPVHTFKVMEAM